MVALLGELRREMNGAVASSMRYYGAAYGLNYGVSLPTLRSIARRVGTDHDFARYLFCQDVRELRLAALHIADPARLGAEEFTAWAAGIVNSEVAEEAAFALLGRAGSLPELFRLWTASDRTLLRYAALLAAARSDRMTADSFAIDAAVEAVRRNPDDRLTAVGAVALLQACAARNEENRQAVIRAVGSLGKLPAEDYVHEELAWRLEA